MLGTAGVVFPANRACLARTCFPRLRPQPASLSNRSVASLRAFSDSAQHLRLEVLCAVGVLAALAISRRPHGWCNTELVQIQESGIHERGVFAKRWIPAGTVLGCFPGFVRTAEEMAAKVCEHQNAQHYVFNAQNGWFLDPTDAQGDAVDGKLWAYADTTLAFVNEPPPGSSTNVDIRDGKHPLDILFVASRGISAAEELLVDYGSLYDRSSYGK